MARPAIEVLPHHSAPRTTGAARLDDGRTLGFAEFGDPHGLPVLWLHGTPGYRGQIAPEAVAHAEATGVRLIGVARPGGGASTPTTYRNVASFVPDVDQLLERLGLDRVAVVGLSGGGPYTLAMGALLPDKVAGCCVLGGVAPSVGDDAADGGVVALAVTFQWLLRRIQRPTAAVLTAITRPTVPVMDKLGGLVFPRFPEGDRRVFENPGMREMFIGDLAAAITDGGGFRAAARDVVLFGRHWGFELADVEVPVHWWHGTDDWIIPFAHGEWVVGRLPNATLHVQSDAAHLSGYLAAAAVIETARGYLTP